MTLGGGAREARVGGEAHAAELAVQAVATDIVREGECVDAPAWALAPLIHLDRVTGNQSAVLQQPVRGVEP